jgi:hypothetical protein
MVALLPSSAAAALDVGGCSVFVLADGEGDVFENAGASGRSDAWTPSLTCAGTGNTLPIP